jgi:transposase
MMNIGSDPTVVVGIDSSDTYHDVCILDLSDASEHSLHIANDLTGFQRLLEELDKRAPGRSYAFAVENPRSLLARFLLRCGHALYALNPLAVARTRQGYAPTGAKSDALDARVLARMLRERDERKLQPVHIDSAQGTLLAGLVGHRQELIQEKTRLQNQLTALLKSFYPRILELFPDLDAAITLAALKAFPTPTALQRTSRAAWEQFFVGKRYSRPARIPQLWERAQAPQVPVGPVVEAVEGGHVPRLVCRLELVLEQIGELDQAIATAFDAHPDAPFFRSLPAAGPVLAPALLAVLGDNRERWRDWKHLAATIGTAPITKRSGKQKQIGMRFHCDREARNVLHLYAGSSRRRCAWANAYYQRHCQAGKTHSGALRSLGNQWLRIIFRMWHERQPYDEARYLEARQRRHTPKPSAHSEMAA